MEATSFSEAPAARGDYFAGPNSGVGDDFRGGQRALSTSTSLRRFLPFSETERTGYWVAVPLMRERSRNDLGSCRVDKSGSRQIYLFRSRGPDR
jgi:hypothetical protein